MFCEGPPTGVRMIDMRVKRKLGCIQLSKHDADHWVLLFPVFPVTWWPLAGGGWKISHPEVKSVCLDNVGLR